MDFGTPGFGEDPGTGRLPAGLRQPITGQMLALRRTDQLIAGDRQPLFRHQAARVDPERGLPGRNESSGNITSKVLTPRRPQEAQKKMHSPEAQTCKGA